MMVVYTRGTTPADVAMAPRPKAATAKAARPALAGDLAGLQGTWMNQQGHINADNETLTIRDDVLLAASKLPRGGEVRYECRIQLDETASPKAIDFLNPRAGNRSLKTAYGIYELDGDTLKIHKSGIGRGRSSVFNPARSRVRFRSGREREGGPDQRLPFRRRRRPWNASLNTTTRTWGRSRIAGPRSSR